MKINASDVGITVTLGHSLDFSDMDQYVSTLRRVLKIKQPVILDADGLQQCGTAAVQMIFAFLNHLKQEKIPYHWENISQEFKHVMILSGMSSLLEDEKENHGD